MKKILLPEIKDNFRYYRGNLHCHSVISDGKKTPEQLKADYMAHGYSVIAYTDHDAFITHNDLTDENFVALNGYEMEINEPNKPDFRFCRTCHMCLIAKDPETVNTACYHPGYFFGNAPRYADQVKFDPDLPYFQRAYTPERINEMFRIAHESGFFVTYNHPGWSREFYSDYYRYEGMDAMEIQNYSATVCSDDFDNGIVYNELLNRGNRIYCIAADDNHNGHPDDSPYCDSYGGYVMIGAPALTYKNITGALESGCFYTSTGDYETPGPEILGLTYDPETRTVEIATSEARAIYFQTCSRANASALAKTGESVSKGSFYVHPNEIWWRITVVDKNGFKAYTNAYFMDSLE